MSLLVTFYDTLKALVTRLHYDFSRLVILGCAYVRARAQAYNLNKKQFSVRKKEPILQFQLAEVTPGVQP